MKTRLLIIIAIITVSIVITYEISTTESFVDPDSQQAPLKDPPRTPPPEPISEPELENVLCIGGKGRIVNEYCEIIGKYDPATGLPIVENKEQCDMLDGDWNEKQNTCDSKYGVK